MSTGWLELNREWLLRHREHRREVESSEPSGERTRLLALIDARVAAIEAELVRLGEGA